MLEAFSTRLVGTSTSFEGGEFSTTVDAGLRLLVVAGSTKCVTELVVGKPLFAFFTKGTTVGAVDVSRFLGLLLAGLAHFGLSLSLSLASLVSCNGCILGTEGTENVSSTILIGIKDCIAILAVGGRTIRTNTIMEISLRPGTIALGALSTIEAKGLLSCHRFVASSALGHFLLHW